MAKSDPWDFSQSNARREKERFMSVTETKVNPMPFQKKK